MTDATGIRAELAIDGADGCPVAGASREADGRLDDVRWTHATGDAAATERVRLPGDSDPTALDRARERGDGDGTDGGVDADGEGGDVVDGTDFGDGARAVVDGREDTLAEFEREREDCVCERIEALGCPVADVRAEGGTLHVAVRVRDSERLRAVVEAVADGAEHVRLTYVVRGGGGDDGGDPVVVDRGRLTERQREVLGVAHRMGYFDHPRGANASAVAEAVGIAPSTFREHLAAAQVRLVGDLLDRD